MGMLAGWSKRQKITIDHNKIDDDLTNFPVKVIIASDNPIFDTAKSDGADVRFTAADGETLLKFEREVHDANEGIAVYHVKIPSVSDTEDTDFYMYYGNASASDASSPNDVWDSNYKLVLHMGPSLEDSTSNGNDGTNYGTTLGLASDGYYRSFDGINDYVSIQSPTAIPVGSAAFTQEIYYLLFTYEGNEMHTFLSWGTNSNGRANVIRTTANEQGITEGYCHYFWGTPAGFDTFVAQTIDKNTKYKIAVTFNGSNTIKIYHDGDLIITDDVPTVNVSSTNIYIGRSVPTGGEYLNGNIYEVRISSIARSDAWIKATSASLHNELLTFGDEENLIRPRVQVIFI